MKNLILMSIIMLVLSLSSYGQIEKGNYLLGGTGNLGFSSNEGRSSFNIGIRPNVGYFLTDKIALTTSIPLSFYTDKSENWQSRSVCYGLVPGLRYYFAKKEKSAFFASTSFGIFQSKSKTESESNNPFNINKSSNTYTSANLAVGYVYFLNKSIGLETTLGYNRSNSTHYNAQSAIDVNFGLQIYFGRGKKGSSEK
jgi:hypothetical protein